MAAVKGRGSGGGAPGRQLGLWRSPMVRQCNGGPNGVAWCGVAASLVATDRDGLQWFCCGEHTEGAHTEPLEDWFKRLDEGR